MSTTMPQSASDDWQRRANELEQTTSLTKRQSQVAALREKGYPLEKISDILDIRHRTVVDHSRLVNKRYKQAIQTVIELDGIVPDDALDLEGRLAPVLDLERVQELSEQRTQ